MRLEEFDQPSAEESRVDRLKDNAKLAREKATQMGAQAKASADQLKAQSKQRMSHSNTPTTGTTIKPRA
ncbi:hypothetical protein [Candidatus Aalborgicola defluviihabitans]|uniref:hypothetical protein n=1 Tax=Candidatus Aalborgicola defluviihabitans TaxID=3386187 RepID=UPI001EC49DA0|nr:hypothetical protein [Burkholderiales bacterium]